MPAPTTEASRKAYPQAQIKVVTPVFGVSANLVVHFNNRSRVCFDGLPVCRQEGYILRKPSR